MDKNFPGPAVYEIDHPVIDRFTLSATEPFCAYPVSGYDFLAGGPNIDRRTRGKLKDARDRSVRPQQDFLERGQVPVDPLNFLEPVCIRHGSPFFPSGYFILPAMAAVDHNRYTIDSRVV
jgi:hypothetical protein